MWIIIDHSCETSAWNIPIKGKSLTYMKWESACKPGSVENSHSSGCTSPHNSSNLPGNRCGPHRSQSECSPIWSCSGWGLPCRRMLPPTRCALTAPFQPYRYPETGYLGGIFSAALAVGLRPPGVTWHPVLWSPDFPPYPEG